MYTIALWSIGSKYNCDRAKGTTKQTPNAKIAKDSPVSEPRAPPEVHAAAPVPHRPHVSAAAAAVAHVRHEPVGHVVEVLLLKVAVASVARQPPGKVDVVTLGAVPVAGQPVAAGRVAPRRRRRPPAGPRGRGAGRPHVGAVVRVAHVPEGKVEVAAVRAVPVPVALGEAAGHPGLGHAAGGHVAKVAAGKVDVAALRAVPVPLPPVLGLERLDLAAVARGGGGGDGAPAAPGTAQIWTVPVAKWIN